MRISDWSSDVCSSDLDLEGLTIAPPANSDQSFQLTVTATSAEGANGETNTQTATVDVTIDAVADAPELTVGDVSGEEGATVPLDLSAALTDTDGSEALSIPISGLPIGASLSHGAETAPGVWSVDAADLGDIAVTLPADSDQDFQLKIGGASCRERVCQYV